MKLDRVDVKAKTLVVDELANFFDGVAGDYDGKKSGVEGYGCRNGYCIGGEAVVRVLIECLVLIGCVLIHC